MKVSITGRSKSVIHMDGIETAKGIIAELKEDSSTVGEYAAAAVLCAWQGVNIKAIYTASAEIARNCRAWNAFTIDSADYDVWVEAAVLTTEGFCEIGAYLTDIWRVDGDNNEEIGSHMYIRRYLPVK